MGAEKQDGRGHIPQGVWQGPDLALAWGPGAAGSCVGGRGCQLEGVVGWGSLAVGDQVPPHKALMGV